MIISEMFHAQCGALDPYVTMARCRQCIYSSIERSTPNKQQQPNITHTKQTNNSTNIRISEGTVLLCYSFTVQITKWKWAVITLATGLKLKFNSSTFLLFIGNCSPISNISLQISMQFYTLFILFMLCLLYGFRVALFVVRMTVTAHVCALCAAHELIIGNKENIAT